MIRLLLISILFLKLTIVIGNTNVIEVKFKIDDEIITNIDINNEIKYLKIINPSLKNFQNQQILNFAKNSIVREVIKKKEIEKFFLIDYESENVDNFIQDLINFLNIENINKFENYLLNYDIDILDIKKKFIIEKYWNQLIYQKYIDQVRIDYEKLKAKIDLLIKNEKEETIFFLKEIVFPNDKKDLLNKKLNQITNSIDNNGFDATAVQFSIADTAISGGKIGWVKQSELSEMILNEIINLKIGEYSKTINTPGGNLILQVSDKKKERTKKILDKDKELQILAEKERNRQLNEYSLIYFKKLESRVFIEKF